MVLIAIKCGARSNGFAPAGQGKPLNCADKTGVGKLNNGASRNEPEELPRHRESLHTPPPNPANRKIAPVLKQIRKKHGVSAINPLYFAPYATIVDISRKKLPSKERPNGRTSKRFILALHRYGLTI
jgi:hypothetical protein